MFYKNKADAESYASALLIYVVTFLFTLNFTYDIMATDICPEELS